MESLFIVLVLEALVFSSYARYFFGTRIIISHYEDRALFSGHKIIFFEIHKSFVTVQILSMIMPRLRRL